MIFVLIETLWNVKEDTITFSDESFFVLIETLWNVKLFNVLGGGMPQGY